ncbi:MFS transporter [Marinitenerispora sediminis]|uniref:MFS transporter n=1 Tax=Marinitenerispora sediminis TaxID=1931232 RepID=A0A368T6G2_9ACTN|nr:MFS transporter [Marinitenerispora sediminis]RCV48317.1 MFS transporter [Marinitenerispora sediminis]RCV49434.1 MFS transporter [Marinitenerispora sediminis]RCV59238.1 MFS transporter [Marinitenerispora sediminis]
MTTNAAALERRRRPALTLLVVCAAITLVPVTATGASVAVTDISGDLDTGLSAAQWVVNAFFLTFASFMAITGSLADMFGRRRMFAAGVALFCAAMLVATFAPHISVLVGARVLAGIGAAAATTGGSAVLAQTFDGQARVRAFAFFGTAIGLGLAFGPLIAGVLVTSLGGWRGFFLAAAVVLLPALLASPLLAESRDADAAGVDWAGAVTFTVGLSLFVLGMVQSAELGWGHPLILGAFAAFVVLMAVFTAVERRRARPMFDVSLFARPRFLAICAMPVLLAFGFVALLIVLPPYFMAVDGVSAQYAGLLLVLLTGPTLVVPTVIGSVAGRISQRLLLVATMLLVAVGAAWLTVIEPGSGVLQLAGPMLTIGTGFGISLAILDGAAVSSVEPSRAGMAAGMFNTMRLTGEAVAIALLGALLAAVTQSRLTETMGSGAQAATARLLQGDMAGAVSAAPAGSAPEALVQAAGAAYTDALHIGLWAIAVLSLLGAIAVGALMGGRPAAGAEAADGAAADRESALVD